MGLLQPDAPWPTFQRCPSHAGLSPGSGPATPTVRWEAPCPYRLLTGVAIDRDGVVYGCGSVLGEPFGALTARHVLDGEPLWDALPRYHDEVFTGHPAVLADGTVLVPTQAGLVALSAEGEHLWLVPSDAVRALGAPLPAAPDRVLQVVRGLVTSQRSLLLVDPAGVLVDLVRSTDHPAFGASLQLAPNPALLPDAATLFSARLGPQDRQGPALLVQCQLTGECAAVREFVGGSLGPPVIAADGTRFILHVEPEHERPVLLGFDADGDEVQRIEGADGEGEATGLVQAGGAPALGPDGALYLATSLWPGSGASQLRVYERSGALRFEVDLPAAPSTLPVVDADGVAFIGTREHVVAIERDGRERFRLELAEPWPLSLALDGAGHLLVQGQTSLLAVGP